MARHTFICSSLLVLAAIVGGGCASGGSGDAGGGGGGAFGNLFQPAGGGQAWTIQCLRIPEDIPDRKESIEQMADALRRTPGIEPDKVQVAHDEDASYVYYGRYRAHEQDGNLRFDQATLDQVEAIRSLAIGESHVFLGTHLVPVPTGDVGPPEWNVKRCPGPYTLEVGEFFNEGRFTERKQAAVDVCRLLRERGYEAYYWHGPQRSNVYVGAWTPKKDFIIAPEGVYPGPEMNKLIESDPDLLKYKIVNGGYTSMIVNGKKVRTRSMPVEVPGRTTEAESASTQRPRYRPMRR